jgi:hypothetical protein
MINAVPLRLSEKSFKNLPTTKTLYLASCNPSSILIVLSHTMAKIVNASQHLCNCHPPNMRLLHSIPLLALVLLATHSVSPCRSRIRTPESAVSAIDIASRALRYGTVTSDYVGDMVNLLVFIRADGFSRSPAWLSLLAQCFPLSSQLLR